MLPENLVKLTNPKTKKLREILTSKDLRFLMEAHNGLSGRIAEEAGFEGLWGSSLTISASMGVRDSNEMSWTQVLEILDFINDATSVPLLFDGDTGFGNFNNVRRLVRKLEQLGVAGVCIEDKLFPKTNSFIDSTRQALADIDEFAGKIKAGKDAQADPDFSIVARVEAFVAGWGLAETLKRADAYHRAGADAILIHSTQSHPNEVLEFMKEWGDRCPLVIVPTRYYSTPTEVFRKAGFSVVIWANHLLRSCVNEMQQVARQLRKEESLVTAEDRIAPVAEVFRLQGADELRESEKRYLPAGVEHTRAVILAASRGKELGALTENRPKTLIPISGKPLLYHLVDCLNEIGIKDITVVRGYKKEMISGPNLSYVDNDEYDDTLEAYSLFKGIEGLTSTTLVTYGDVLFNKYIPMSLLESDADFSIAVDANWQQSRNRGRYADFVSCDVAYVKERIGDKASLKTMDSDLSPSRIQGEWMGLLRISKRGLGVLQAMLSELALDELKRMRMSEILNRLTDQGETIQVVYTVGHWLDLDDVHDLSDASTFQRAPQ